MATNMKKRIIVCSDGTWQTLNTATSISTIYSRVKTVASDDIVQVKFYDPGVGTGSICDRYLGVFGKGLKENVKDCYKFIQKQYQERDEIFLFGYSRGAYTVRVLAALLNEAGINESFDKAWSIYRSRKGGCNNSVPVKFLGCFDTVGSLGIPDVIPVLPINQWLNYSLRFINTTVGINVEHARHALALHEQRRSFTPSLMETNKVTDIEQCWFGGDHGVMGGNGHYLSDYPFNWMINEAGKLGLELRPQPVNINKMRSPQYNFQPKGIFRFLPRCDRQVSVTQKVHPSVARYWLDQAKDNI